MADATSMQKTSPTFTTLALTICRLSSGNIFNFRSISNSMSLMMLSRSLKFRKNEKS